MERAEIRAGAPHLFAAELAQSCREVRAHPAELPAHRLFGFLGFSHARTVDSPLDACKRRGDSASSARPASRAGFRCDRPPLVARRNPRLKHQGRADFFNLVGPSMWAKLHDSFAFDHQLLPLGDLGFAVYARALAYAAGQLSDGFVPSGIVAALDPTGDALRGLTAAGLWSPCEGGIQIVEWSRRQRLREQVVRERQGSLQRVRAHRNAVSNAVTPPVTNAVSNARCNAHSEGEGEEDGEEREGESQNEKRFPSETLCPPPPAAVTGSLFPASPEAPKPEKPKRAKREAPPLPWKPEELVAVIAAHGRKRFTEGLEARHMSGANKIQLYGLIRAFPERADWENLVAWLDAGGAHGLEAPYGWGILCCGSVRSWMASASEWHRKGRFDLAEARAHQRLADRGAEIITDYYRNEFASKRFQTNGRH